jgi:hypothetical protein
VVETSVMSALHGRRAPILALVVAFALTALAAAPAGASAADLSLRDAREVAVTKMKRMQRDLKSEGAKSSSVRGCWRENGGIGCLGLVSGRDSFLRWRCAVPMTLRKRPAASASRRVAVKFTDPMCSF